MGIPVYYKELVQKYPDIVVKLNLSTLPSTDLLFFDANGIIYDQIAKLCSSSAGSEQIINATLRELDNYIALFAPKKRTFVFFDGVCPRAKLDQQKDRREKGYFQSQIVKRIGHESYREDAFNTVLITPATEFMNTLNHALYQWAAENNCTITASGSDQHGEGEHKICEYLRSNDVSQKNVKLFGLDADLIILSLTYRPRCKSIYLFRETPHFIKNICPDLEPNEKYLLDIGMLATSLDRELGRENVTSDYTFITFMLGNDFLPHFPAINIRTGGIDKLLKTYTTVQKPIIDAAAVKDLDKISWANFRAFVKPLADGEEAFMRREMQIRDKKSRYGIEQTDVESNDRYKKFEKLPIYKRELEKRIDPYQDGWRIRYYKELFQINPTEERIKEICINYLEGLEWTFKYYTAGCPDWKWRYKYMYPPLLCDLYRYIPVFSTTFIQQCVPSPVTPLVQLCYVLPRKVMHDIIPAKIYDAIMDNFPDAYPESPKFIWAFCQYFWESHTIMHDIDLDELATVVNRANVQKIAA